MLSTHNDRAMGCEPDALSSVNTNDTIHAVLPSKSPDVPAPDCSSGSVSKSDPTLIQNQISLQRASSITKSNVSSSHSNPLPAKTSSGYFPSPGQPGSLNGNAKGSRPRGDSTGSVTNGVSGCALSKSNSISAKSIDSVKSAKSVKSVTTLGPYHFGSLRVHSDRTDRRELSPDCLLSGSVVLVTGMPSGSIFGLDMVSFTLGKEGYFEGVRDIPNGPHFVYGGSSSELSTRTGFWIMSQRRGSDDPGEIFIKRWDSYSETLEDELSAAEVRIQQENVPKVFDRLMPYTTKAPCRRDDWDMFCDTQSFTESIFWKRLTFAIKGAMLSRITGQSWNKWQVSSTHDMKPMEIKPTDAKMDTILQLQDARAEQMVGKDSILTFAFPRTSITYSPEVIGRARTEQAMDTSAHIVAVISDRCTYEDSDEVIGELQFCYLTGVLLGNVACQEQWAHIVKITFKAFRLAMDMPVLFRKLIETIHTQLLYDEKGIEGSIFDHDVYLRDELKVILTVFKSRLNEQLLEKGVDLTYEQSDVGKAFEALESWLWKWGWDLRGNYLRSGKIQLEDGEFVDAELKDFEDEDERGEFAPVVVDLDENGRERGLIRW